MDIWDLSMALAFAVTSASVGLLMFLVSYHTSSTTQRKTKHQQVYYRKSPRKDVHGTQNCTLTQVSATTSVLTSRREKREQSGLFSGGFVSNIPSCLATTTECCTALFSSVSIKKARKAIYAAGFSSASTVSPCQS